MHHTYIFDFDGTLVDSMPSWAEKVLSILRGCGVAYPSNIINIVTPLGDRGTADYMRDVLGVSLSLEEIFRQMDEYALPKYRDEIAIKDGVSSAVTSRTYSKVEGGGDDEPGGDDH